MWYLQDVKESKRIWDLLLTIMENFQPAYIVIQHVWSVLIIFTEYLCQDWNKGFYLLQGTFLSFVPPAGRESFVRWVCEWVILFSGVKGSKDGQGGLCDGCKNMFKRLIGMTLLLWFDCSSVNSYSPPRMQPYAFLYPAPWILIQENIGHKAREGMSYPDWAGSSQILSVLK